MAHTPIAIDCAGADGCADGAGGVEPGPSNDHGGDGACIDQVDFPTAPPRPSAHDKDGVHHPVCGERAPVSQNPQAPHTRFETVYGVCKGGAAHVAIPLAPKPVRG